MAWFIRGWSDWTFKFGTFIKRLKRESPLAPMIMKVPSCRQGMSECLRQLRLSPTVSSPGLAGIGPGWNNAREGSTRPWCHVFKLHAILRWWYRYKSLPVLILSMTGKKMQRLTMASCFYSFCWPKSINGLPTIHTLHAWASYPTWVDHTRSTAWACMKSRYPQTHWWIIIFQTGYLQVVTSIFRHTQVPNSHINVGTSHGCFQMSSL
jgi:hypothetical protein